MSQVEEVRAQLIALETEQADDLDYLREADAELERLSRERAKRDEAQARRRAEIAKARQELERQQQLEAAREQAHEVETGTAALESQFEALAKGHVWYEGTGNNDAILPHQWLGMMFGAVAERWILGDGVGLGKTRTCVGWLDLTKAKKVLIVCEANICNQFAGEVMELAPHRTIVNLYKRKAKKGQSWPALRHEILDSLMSMDEAVVVVNYEIWRRDKDILAKLMEWEIDTIIVDEAHNLKSTKSVNFTTLKALIACDNLCGNCGKHIRGLYDPEALKETPSRKVAKPCASCGWKIGQRKRVEHVNPLTDSLVTKSVKRLVLTTGTPILNEPTDLYALLHLCDPILFKSRAGFETTFLTNNYHSGKWEFRAGALAMLKPLIEGRFLARTRKDAGVTLPPQHNRVIRVELDPQDYPLQYRTIKQVTDMARIILSSGKAMTIMHLIALITRKRQANVWPGGIEIVDRDEDSPTYGEVIFSVGEEVQESVKMDACLDEILMYHEQGRRQIVFSQFSTGIEEFQRRVEAKGLRAVALTGKTSKGLREEIKSNFYRAKGEEPKWDVVLCNYKAGGTGINLTSASVTHILDEEWNPGKRNQAYGRTDRMGQTEENDVLIYRIPGSIDTWVANTIHRKEQMIEGFNDTMLEKEPVSQQSLMQAILSGEIL